MIYVFARWRPSEKIRLDVPMIYYISCDNRDIAEKLAGTLQRFGTDKGNVIELPGVDDLRKRFPSIIRYPILSCPRFPSRQPSLWRRWIKARSQCFV